MLFDELSVSENIFVGQYLYKGLLKTLDWPAMHRRANEILTRLEVQIDPRATLKTLSICLLYTSPSPRDCVKSRMPSSA